MQKVASSRERFFQGFSLIAMASVAILLLACVEQEKTVFPEEPWQRIILDLCVVQASHLPDSTRQALFGQVLRDHGVSPGVYQQFHTWITEQPVATQVQWLKKVDQQLQVRLDSLRTKLFSGSVQGE